MTTTHELKLWTDFFEDTYRKPFELRRNDRGFQVGDRLHLREWDKDAQAYTGRECMREVLYVLPEGSPGLADGFVGLGLGPWFGVQRTATVDEAESLRWAATWEERQ